MDQRFVALGTGAVLGLALVVGLAFARPYLPASSAEPAGFVEPQPMAPVDLAQLLATPRRWTAAGETVLLSATPAGELVLPSGRLVIADAFFLGLDTVAARRALPAGEHPVTMLEARGDSWTAPAALLVSSGGSVRSWARIGEASYVGAETGVVALAPAELNERLTEDAEAGDLVIDRVAEAYEATTGDDVASWVDIEGVDGLHLYTVVSDLGVLAAHWGLDGDGEPVALLLDFGLLDPPSDG